MTSLYVITCKCGREVRSHVAPAAVRCSCGRVCEIIFTALDERREPNQRELLRRYALATISGREGLK